MQRSAIRLAVALTLGFSIAGCGESGPVLWPVKGRVVFRDRLPVNSGVIEFSPVEGGPVARASIGVDGRFELRTGDRLGAVAGQHRIAIVQAAIAEGAASHARRRHEAKVVHPKYARFGTSELTRVVEPNAGNDLIIEVAAAVERQGW